MQGLPLRWRGQASPGKEWDPLAPCAGWVGGSPGCRIHPRKKSPLLKDTPILQPPAAPHPGGLPCAECDPLAPCIWGCGGLPWLQDTPQKGVYPPGGEEGHSTLQPLILGVFSGGECGPLAPTFSTGEGVSPQVQDVTLLHAVLERGDSPGSRIHPMKELIPSESHPPLPGASCSPPPWGSPHVQSNVSSPRLVLRCPGVAGGLLVRFILH